MKWFLDLTTRSKLSVGFGLMIVFLVGVIGIAYRDITLIQTAQQKLYEKEFASVVDLLQLRSTENGIRAALLSMMDAQSASDREAWRQEINQRSKEATHLIQQLKERNMEDPGATSRLDELTAMRDEFAHTRETRIIPLIYEGQKDKARALAVGVQDQRYRKMRGIAEEMGQRALKKVQQSMAESRQLGEQMLQTFMNIGVVGLLVALAMVIMLNRVIAVPLRSFARIANQVAAGDLTVAAPVEDRADEVGELMRTFDKMVDNLRQTTRELHEGVGVLAAASSEILATTSQVTSGASQTASAVSETSATVTEVKQTAQLASQKARFVSDSAQTAAQVSQTGRQSVEDSIAGMHRIQEQMESIAESIVLLSEQSQAIGDIIATVNDLAEQSNVLAVNAAIEANKAGEHGKGFVIVAQEVKSLAEQSKQATSQVRTILGDIQRATSAAVLATEQGHKAVEAGVTQSTEAGQSISQLAESINEAAQAATQIAASSQQQMVGMDQVAEAMENIKQASNQNVAGAKQVEVAAQNLHELGTRLKQTAGRYQV